MVDGGWLVVASIVGMFVLLSVALWRRSRHSQAIDPHTGRVLPAAKLAPPEGWMVRTYVLCYAGYVVLLVVTVVTAFVWVLAVRALLPFTPIDEDWHNVSFWLIMLAIWIGLIVLVAGGEIYMRTGIEQRQGLRRLSQIAMALGAVLGVGVLVLQLTQPASM